MELETITVSHTLTPGMLTTLKSTPNPAHRLSEKPSAIICYSPREEVQSYTTLKETAEQQIARLMPGGQFKL